MTHEVIKSRPPNFDKIVKRFPGAARPYVLFAYAPYIYAPGGNVPPELMIHEGVHIARQEEIGVEVWWDHYLADPAFRYAEELLAHRAEYQHLMAADSSRANRRRALKQVAEKLAHSLYEYGRLVNMDMAKKDLQA